MNRSNADILADIAAFNPKEMGWGRLIYWVSEIWVRGDPTQAIDGIFGIFERFPHSDGDGAFWEIASDLKTLPNYEVHLVESICRVPSDMATYMLLGLGKAGAETAGGKPIRELMQGVVESDRVSQRARMWAGKLLIRGAVRE